MKRTDDSILVFRGMPDDEVRAMMTNWMEWCADLTGTLLKDGASGDAIPARLLDEPELPFLALPYAVRVGARR